jgi:hypothetical protein
MERVELAESKPLKRLSANGVLGLWDDNFIRKLEERQDIVPSFQVRVAAGFDSEHPAAHPNRPARLHQSKNTLDCFRLIAYACLALIVRQPVQATGVQIDLQLAILPSTRASRFSWRRFTTLAGKRFRRAPSRQSGAASGTSG